MLDVAMGHHQVMHEHAQREKAAQPVERGGAVVA